MPWCMVTEWLSLGMNLWTDMIRQRFYIKEYDWWVTAYYAVSRYNIGEIMYSLYSIGCDGEYMQTAYRNLKANKIDSGLTHSNYMTRQSVMVTALSSSAKQFHQALMHEIRHLQSHIATTFFLDEKSEQVCYLLDEIVGLTHETTSKLLCNCCREKHKHYGNK